MKHSLSSNIKINIKINDGKLHLEIVPVTFLKLIDINNCLEDKTLDEVLNAPEVLDIAKVCYCLLDEKSLNKIKEIKVNVKDIDEEITDAHKLFYLISDTNIDDGMNNYSEVLQGIVKQLKTSTGTNESQVKKKVLKIPF